MMSLVHPGPEFNSKVKFIHKPHNLFLFGFSFFLIRFRINYNHKHVMYTCISIIFYCVLCQHLFIIILFWHGRAQDTYMCAWYACVCVCVFSCLLGNYNGYTRKYCEALLKWHDYYHSWNIMQLYVYLCRCKRMSFTNCVITSKLDTM